MDCDLEYLDLTESYLFNVLVKDKQNYFAAKLELSPKKITLTVMGEEYGDRNYSNSWSNVDRVICNDLNRTFILFNLRMTQGLGKRIQSNPDDTSFFEIVYNVSHLVFHPSPISVNTSIRSLDIHSSALKKWIGNTNKQENIIKLYEKGKIPDTVIDDLEEFCVDIDDIGHLVLGYNLSIYSSSTDFHSGISFPPSLFMFFRHELDNNQLISTYDRIYSLLAFFIGDDFLVKSVRLSLRSNYSREGSLYYPTSNRLPKYNNNYALFPLGTDLRFDHLNLPELPLNVFNNYYNLTDTKISYYQKYIKYRRMQNPEDRFLGYFRILESLVFKKKNYLDEELLKELSIKAKPYLNRKFGDKKSVSHFLNNLPWYNSSKYKTEKCIQDFYLNIPNSLCDLIKLGKSDIGEICKLRNDITHANDYYVSDNELEEKTKFIEVLLVLALFELIGVDVTTAAEVVNRIDGYCKLKIYETDVS